MRPRETSSAAHYWYGSEAGRKPAVTVLEALRAYGEADAAMRRRSERVMRMSENDISALRYLLRAKDRGISVGPKEIGAHLGLQSSSITVLLDRLEKAGHVRREPSPFDRRALIIEPSVPVGELQEAILGDTRAELLEAAGALEPEVADAVVQFMDRLRAAVDRVDAPLADRSTRGE